MSLSTLTKTLALTSTFFFIINVLNAQSNSQDSSKLKIAGMIDIYYRYNFGDSINNYTSFTNSQNTFAIGMISATISQQFNQVGFLADIGFGKRAEEFSYNEKNTLFAIKQLYLYYDPSPSIRISAGSWDTHIGYESVDPVSDINYSMSYLFSYGPFFQTGLKATYTKENFGCMAGIVDPSDFKTFNFSKKYLISQLYFYAFNKKLKTIINTLNGKTNEKSKNHQYDLVLQTPITKSLMLTVNSSIMTSSTKEIEHWSKPKNKWGTAIYLSQTIKNKHYINCRFEYFNDKTDVLTIPVALKPTNHDIGIYSATLSGNFNIYKLCLIPEIKYDCANEAIYYQKNKTTRHTTSFLLAALYKF